MFDKITALGYGIVVFGIIIGVGSIVLYEFSGSVATCANPSTFTYNSTTNLCSNGTDTASAGGSAYTNINTALTELGSSGLAGWLPSIIAISIGLLFLGAFTVLGGSKRRY